MPRATGLPARVPSVSFSKAALLEKLRMVDESRASTARVLSLEYGFRARIEGHLDALPHSESLFSSFATNPFVLAMYARLRGYRRVSQIASDILPAKLFSSMETSAGRLVEDVVLPVYGWEPAPSGMHTSESAIDGVKVTGPRVSVATLKSGPRCLNDEMSENFADNIASYGAGWVAQRGGSELDFTYGVLYGTKRKSNKKDWHILNKLCGRLSPDAVLEPPAGRWDCRFMLGEVRATASVRVGSEWWEYLGGATCLVEVCAALVRACIDPEATSQLEAVGGIADFAEITSVPPVGEAQLFSLLQRSQLPWFFLVLSHFCDELRD